MIREIKYQFWKLYFLCRTDAPLWVILVHFYLNSIHNFSNKFCQSGRGYRKRKDAFLLKKNSLKLDNDWFTSNIPTWLRAIDKAMLRGRESLLCLEVGSWQGLSAFFILNELPLAHLTCIDTWEGADEHKNFSYTTAEVLAKIEQTFDSNLAIYKDRLKKYKGTSFSYFDNEFERDRFDLIYVDGSHYCDDVIVDAVKCFEMLRIGGVIIFDDYFWRHYSREIDNPAGAINAFLRMKRHQLKIICFDYQLIITKTSGSVGEGFRNPNSCNG